MDNPKRLACPVIENISLMDYSIEPVSSYLRGKTEAKVALNLFQLLRLFFCRWIRMAFGFLLGIIAGERSGEEVA